VESEDSLFYGNRILGHNSAYGNLEVGMESVADSIGLAQTADLLVALVSNEQMQSENKVIMKFLKNRLEGFLGTISLKVDYFHMKYEDWEDGEYSNNSNSTNQKKDSDLGLDLGEFSFD
jgi:hypothetical protein